MHVRAIFVAVAACVGGALSFRADATEAPRAAGLQRGEHIARLICSACHVVAADQEFPPLLRPPAPSFEDIANRPGTSIETVQRFVTETHWDMKTLPAQMPHQMLSKAETVAVARYLLSLRKH